MKRAVSVNLGNLVLSLSDAMDLASPLLSQHQQRTAFIVWELGKIAKLPDERQENNFIAALLHDVGALSLEDKISIRNAEVEDVDKHCVSGERLLDKVPWLEGASRIVRFHHRKWRDWNESIDTHPVMDSQLLFLGDYIERSINRN